MKNYLIIEQGNEKECRIVESVILNDRYSLEHYWNLALLQCIDPSLHIF